MSVVADEIFGLKLNVSPLIRTGTFCLLRSYQIRNVLYLPYSIPAPNLNFLINILPMGWVLL